MLTIISWLFFVSALVILLETFVMMIAELAEKNYSQIKRKDNLRQLVVLIALVLIPAHHIFGA